MKSIQEAYAPDNRCFGCGPANDKGLRIRSFEEGDQLVAEWSPQPHHQAFDGILNGGIDDLATHRTIARVDLNARTVANAEFSPDGRLFAIASAWLQA